jgi:hypothetical protein
MSRNQVGIIRAGKQSIEPEEYVSKGYASTLVAARQARWINRGKDILLNKTPKPAVSVEVYAAHRGKLGAENIPFDHVSPARAAYLMQKAKVESLDAQAIVISDRRMSNMMQWQRYARPERQGHSRPRALQSAERLVEGQACAMARIEDPAAGWAQRIAKPQSGKYTFVDSKANSEHNPARRFANWPLILRGSAGSSANDDVTSRYAKGPGPDR